MVLAELGKAFFACLQWIFLKIYRFLCTRRKKLTPDQIIDVPVWVGILATIIWVSFCAMIFAVVERWPYSIGFYFTFLSVTTNALGGVEPKNMNMFFLTFCVIVGLGLVSMSISVQISIRPQFDFKKCSQFQISLFQLLYNN
jgi:hypothetical protein